MEIRRHVMKGLIPLTALMLLASACSGGEDLDQNEDSGATSSSAADLSGETVEVAATWTGAEQDRFQMVLDAFAEQTGATVRFRSAGDDVAAYVGPEDRRWRPARRGDPAAARRAADVREAG